MSSWLHDTGYGPALDHEGGVTLVVEAGTDPDIPPDQVGPRVIGWRAGCQCGWRGTRFFLRADGRTTDWAIAPEQVAELCRADWERHLRAALPVLGIHDFTRRVEDAQENLVEAVRAARAAGVGWTLIGQAAGISGARAKARWSEATRARRAAAPARPPPAAAPRPPAGRGRRRPCRASGADAEPGAVTVYPAPMQGIGWSGAKRRIAAANCSKSRTTSKDPTVISARRLWASGRTAIRRRIATVMLRVRQRGRSAAFRAARITGASVAAYLVAQALGLRSPPPLIAALTALLVVQATLSGTLTNGVQRVLSVVAGVALAMLFVAVVGLTWWSLAALVAASIVVGQLLRLGPHLVEVPISAMLVLGGGYAAGAESTGYGRVIQ